MERLVEYITENNIGIVTITREKAMNALNSQVLKELSHIIDESDLDVIRCLIVTGAGTKAFVAGADIGEMRGLNKAEGENFGILGNDVFLKLENLPIPTIAAVNGFALGGGCELCLSCDIRIASENALFGQPETGLGITPGFGGTQRLPRIIGVGLAKELIYTCNKLNPQEALSAKLVSAVYPPEELMDAAKKMAGKIARNAPIAVRASKKAINEGISAPIGDAVRIESKCFGSCFETEDQKNGMTAFLEKRKPEAYINK
ncbi:MAG: enoyl-CoA hydratase-related protein [Oscillospiraceae bacterium]